jgi:hypothetical protein
MLILEPIPSDPAYSTEIRTRREASVMYPNWNLHICTVSVKEGSFQASFRTTHPCKMRMLKFQARIVGCTWCFQIRTNLECQPQFLNKKAHLRQTLWPTVNDGCGFCPRVASIYLHTRSRLREDRDRALKSRPHHTAYITMLLKNYTH